MCPNIVQIPLKYFENFGVSTFKFNVSYIQCLYENYTQATEKSLSTPKVGSGLQMCKKVQDIFHF